MFEKQVDWCKEKYRKGKEFVINHKVETGIVLGSLLTGVILPKVADKILYEQTDGLNKTFSCIDGPIENDPGYALRHNTYYKYRIGNRYHRAFGEYVSEDGAVHTMREYDRILKAKGIDWQEQKSE